STLFPSTSLFLSCLRPMALWIGRIVPPILIGVSGIVRRTVVPITTALIRIAIPLGAAIDRRLPLTMEAFQVPGVGEIVIVPATVTCLPVSIGLHNRWWRRRGRRRRERLADFDDLVCPRIDDDLTSALIDKDLKVIGLSQLNAALRPGIGINT